MNWVERYLNVIPAQAGSQATTGGVRVSLV